MTKAELIAKTEGKLRSHLMKLNPGIVSFIYSSGRKYFINILAKETPIKEYIPPQEKQRICWNLKFNCPLFNAAGMFKNGEAYHTVAAQGAGAYLAGTTTSGLRSGNIKSGIRHPFMPYPASGAASNWMGLPNQGHAIVAKRLSSINKKEGCPVGISVSINPEANPKEGLNDLMEGLFLYEKANVDFIELNESCPNVIHEHGINDENGLDKNLVQRLETISELFLRKRKRNLPVLLKLSNDTNVELLPKLLDIMLDLSYDGFNLGNTSTDYLYFRDCIDETDRKNYDFFIDRFGGGLSGRLLKERSLELSSVAAKYLTNKYINREFHIIRTGGIENAEDVLYSDNSGVSLNQWFTGYFEGFARFGHLLYKKIYS
ncbi:hypothetical protein ACFLSQ_02295 [Bacteroidota bacterium]